MYEEHPELENRLTVGNRTIIDAKIFQKMPEIFFEESPDDNYLKVYGRDGNNHVYRWTKRAYIRDIPNLHKYKVYLPGANNAGNLGETLSMPEIGYPETCHTQTFMSFGIFDTEGESLACLKYITSKFARLLLGTLKVTQNNPKKTWSNIPIQDFTPDSDIDWSKSVSEIDRQLYAKYQLDEKEIAFIESHVKAME